MPANEKKVTIRVSEDLYARFIEKAGHRGINAAIVGLMESWLAPQQASKPATPPPAALPASRPRVPAIPGMVRAIELIPPGAMCRQCVLDQRQTAATHMWLGYFSCDQHGDPRRR